MDCIMEVGAGNPAGITGKCHQLTFFNTFSSADHTSGQVAVDTPEAITMINDQVASTSDVIPATANPSICSTEHLGTSWNGQVNPSVKGSFMGERIASVSVARGYPWFTPHGIDVRYASGGHC